mmetsp:Transcript_3153/g.3828  ORF Transcript_3153/g.3828 Transcript_3153/m.3828 type:complete len:89 (-) Transcript_3153:267-533(-)
MRVALTVPNEQWVSAFSFFQEQRMTLIEPNECMRLISSILVHNDERKHKSIPGRTPNPLNIPTKSTSSPLFIAVVSKPSPVNNALNIA